MNKLFKKKYSYNKCDNQKVKMKYMGKEINKWISIKVYLVETVQHRVCVCVRKCHPSLKKLKHCSPFFLYAQGTASNKGTTFNHERDMVTPL